MRIVPGKKKLRKSVLLYRKMRHRGGHGIHSPFVYNLVTKVIDEKCGYYRYSDIELVRKQLLQNTTPVTYTDRRSLNKQRTSTVSKLTKREAVNQKQGKLLFRLTNYFKPTRILQVGSGMGLSTLYMTSYDKKVNCVVLEHEAAFTPVLEWVYEKARTPVNLYTGSYKETLMPALKELKTVDFILFDIAPESGDIEYLFRECLKCAHEKTVFVCVGINRSRVMSCFWKEICANSDMTVTIDLYSLGIILLEKKLHKRNYIVSF